MITREQKTIFFGSIVTNFLFAAIVFGAFKISLLHPWRIAEAAFAVALLNFAFWISLFRSRRE